MTSDSVHQPCDLLVLDVAERGREWLVERLGQGLTLSRLVLEELDDLVPVEVRALLPAGSEQSPLRWGIGDWPERGAP